MIWLGLAACMAWLQARGFVAGSTQPAERVLMDGRVDEAVTLLKAQVGGNTNDGTAHLLLCRAYLSEQVVDDAVRECESAVRLMPQSGDAEDWLGRAYGAKANRAGPIAGLKLAFRVRDAFETAYRLDPQNPAVVGDLAEYYVGAPSLVGGGVDKAGQLAAKAEASLPQAAHRIRGLAAESQKDNGTAEREFKAAVAVAQRPDAWVDLGGFYKRTQQREKAVEAFRRCLALDKARDAAVVDVASYLIEMKAEPEMARYALDSYLNGPSKSDAAPVVRVYVLLGELARNAGDKAEAKIEFSRSLELAANYAPAKRALQQL